MATSTFSKIDSNQIASNRQVYAVACHFANIHAKNPSERYGLTKVFNAILNKTYRDQDSYMTHGEATEFFEWDCVPPQFLHMVSKPKKAKKPVKTSKTQKKATPKGKAKKLTNTQRIDSLESKMDKILEILSAK
jgi:pectate lyase